MNRRIVDIVSSNHVKRGDRFIDRYDVVWTVESFDSDGVPLLINDEMYRGNWFGGEGLRYLTNNKDE